MKKNQHVVPNNGAWSVKGTGNSRNTKTFETQREAIDFGRNIARTQEAELLIHNKQGRIRQKNSYGNDPYPPKG
ncbi:MAG: DUF2188 domain-containing protein [Tannerellaceae bacterium]|nr:DUF2188 domain-containing protein [Tannerellaceae bacterium]